MEIGPSKQPKTTTQKDECHPNEIRCRGKRGEVVARGWGLAIVALSIIMLMVLRLDVTLI